MKVKKNPNPAEKFTLVFGPSIVGWPETARLFGGDLAFDPNLLAAGRSRKERLLTTAGVQVPRHEDLGDGAARPFGDLPLDRWARTVYYLARRFRGSQGV